MPSGEIATVKSVEQEGRHLTVARAGEGVDVGLNGIDPGMLSPGGVVCHPDYPVPVATRFEIRLLTLEIRTPILKGSQVCSAWNVNPSISTMTCFFPMSSCVGDATILFP